ncbi:MAG: IMS domain-containing protein [Cyanobacterium sp.]
MQIPLDYYRILGVPLQAEDNLIHQAYEDRMLQLPRSEYSQYAIASRQNLIKLAHAVLQDEESRQQYDDEIFPSNGSAIINGDGNMDMSIDDALSLSETSIVTPTIEADGDLLLGALMMLQELGEYELLLNIAQSFLEGKESLEEISTDTNQLQLWWQDLILTVISAYLDLAKEKWHQREYENASLYLLAADAILEQENVFIPIRQEIDSDLQKVRPYEIIELISKADSQLVDRQKAIALLQKMLNSRQGIEGKQPDQSGLNTEDFLRFLQEVRTYLTPLEQEELFKQESSRPSIAATYLTVNALMVRGFVERKPTLIIQAQNILDHLNQYQDVYLEQSICSLLLGNINQAEKLLNHSYESKKVKYIKQLSKGSPDIVPGLIVYAENWFKEELFPHFKNLDKESSSIQAYFNDPRLQRALEQIAPPEIAPMDEQDPLSLLKDYPQEFNPQETPLPSPAIPITSDTSPAEIEEIEEDSSLVGFSSFLEASIDDDESAEPFVMDDSLEEKEETSSTNSFSSPMMILVVLLILLGIFSVLFYRLFNPFREDSLEIVLNQPLIELPEELVAEDASQAPLSAVSALEIVNGWLEAKALATGPDYNLGALENVLADPFLSIWRGNINTLRNQNAYRRYDHDVTIEEVNINPQNNMEANITARVRENSQYFSNGQLNNQQSYDSNLLVRYELIRVNNRWLIRNSQIIN